MSRPTFTTPQSPGDLLSRYPPLGPYPTTAFPPLPNVTKKRRKIDIKSFVPRPGKHSVSGDSNLTINRAVISPTAQTGHRLSPRNAYANEMGLMQYQQHESSRKKIDQAARQKSRKSVVDNVHSETGLSVGPCRIYDAAHVANVDVQKAPVGLDSRYLYVEKSEHASPINPNARSRSGQTAKAVTFKIAIDRCSAPTSLLELYLHDKATEHPAETEQQVRAGAETGRATMEAGTLVNPTSHCESVDDIIVSHDQLDEHKVRICESRHSSSNLATVVVDAAAQNPMQAEESAARSWLYECLDGIDIMRLAGEVLQNIRLANNLHSVSHMTVLSAKLLFILYLATCVWNIMAAIYDAVLKQLEPIFIIIRFLEWATSRTR